MLGVIEPLRADPLRESAHRLLVAVHLAEGNVSAALDQFDAYRRLLRTGSVCRQVTGRSPWCLPTALTSTSMAVAAERFPEEDQ